MSETQRERKARAVFSRGLKFASAGLFFVAPNCPVFRLSFSLPESMRVCSPQAHPRRMASREKFGRVMHVVALAGAREVWFTPRSPVLDRSTPMPQVRFNLQLAPKAAAPSDGTHTSHKTSGDCRVDLPDLDERCPWSATIFAVRDHPPRKGRDGDPSNHRIEI